MYKSISIAILMALLVTFASVPAIAAQPNNLAIPITGSGSAGTFTGSFTPNSFALQGGQVVALGTVTGTVTSAAGVVTSVLQNNVAAPVAAASTASCTILHLVLGPINLNLLGLVVTTNQIVLDISAQPGPGNLLGNLLCAVANLLNNPNQTLINLLNQILGILQGL